MYGILIVESECRFSSNEMNLETNARQIKNLKIAGINTGFSVVKRIVLGFCLPPAQSSSNCYG